MMISKIVKNMWFVVLLATSLSVTAASLSPETIDGATTIAPAQAKALFDEEVLFVDVRKDQDWDAGRVPGAIHLDLKSTYSEDALAKEADKGAKVVIYCNGPKCMRSSKATTMAVAWGFKNVYYFREGFPAWQAAKFPVE